MTDQFSVAADLPYFHAHRRSPGPPTGRNPTYVTAASGFSDLTLTGRYWLGDPKKHSHQNLSVGLGFKLPTGNDRAEDDFLVRVENGVRITEVRPVDQSIQPGDGGFGFIPELQAFKAFGRYVAFASGSYLINPRETNDFNRNGPNGGHRHVGGGEPSPVGRGSVRGARGGGHVREDGGREPRAALGGDSRQRPHRR